MMGFKGRNNRYVVLFVGTPYMDGKYHSVESAYMVKEAIQKKYPYLRLEIAKVSAKFLVTDDIFWARHQQELELHEAS